MEPIWTCPIRTALLRGSFSEIQEADGLWLMAAVYLFGMKVSDRLMDELLREDYPLLAISLAFSDGLPDELMDIRTRRQLPRLELPTAAAVVGGLWVKDRLRGNLAYWCREWNNEWQHMGRLDELSPDVKTHLSEIAERLRCHPDVLDVFPMPNERIEHRLEKITGYWYSAGIRCYWPQAIKLLPIRGILAFALLNAYEVLHEYKEMCEAKGAGSFFTSVARALGEIRSFVETDASDTEAFTTLKDIAIAPQPPAMEPDDLEPEFFIPRVIGAALSCAEWAGRHLLSGDLLHAVVENACESAILGGTDAFFDLLQQELGEFPELGCPVNLGKKRGRESFLAE